MQSVLLSLDARTRIIYTRPDGGISVLHPSPAYLDTLREQGMTEEQAVVAVVAKNVPDGATDICLCDVGDLPPTRRFRNCWRRAGAGLPAVDMPLARQQRMNEVRVERAPKLAQADAYLLRAVDEGNADLAATIRTYRQALRDVPQVCQSRLEQIPTPEALAAWEPVWPELG